MQLLEKLECRKGKIKLWHSDGRKTQGTSSSVGLGQGVGDGQERSWKEHSRLKAGARDSK